MVMIPVVFLFQYGPINQSKVRHEDGWVIPERW
jgi:hypothetical protein